MKLNQLISSKINTPKFLSILMIASILGMSGCNVKEVLTDANGQKKSFILFNPNFLLTNYQIRLVDSLNNFITEDLRVEVLSNKKIVNDEGYYTKSFTTSNGLVNFSVDPNENISATDSIEFSVLVSSDNQKIYPARLRYKGVSKFDRIFKLRMEKVPSNAFISTGKSSLSSQNLGSKMPFDATNPVREKISFDGIELDPNSPGLFKTNPFLKLGFNNWAFSNYGYNRSYNYEEYLFWNYSIPKKSTSNTTLKISYNNVDRITRNYAIDLHYIDKYDNLLTMTVNKDGSTNFYDGSGYITTRPIPNYDGNIIFESGTTLKFFYIKSNEINQELKYCPQGFNFNFTNISKETSPEFEYFVYRNDDTDKRFYISQLGVAKVESKNPTYNTDELWYSNISNKVVFKENSQYYLEPNTLLLNGAGACNSKTDIKIIPKTNMVKYKLAIEAQCKESNYAVTPTINMLFRKKGSKEWEGLTVKNGIGTIYLENNAEYEVTGNAGKTKLNFDFSNNPASFDTQKASSLSKNPDLNNMIYSISDDTNETGTKILKMKVVYNQAGCPLN
jgi:hypothetical protein